MGMPRYLLRRFLGRVYRLLRAVRLHVLTWLYRKLGRAYPTLYLAVELHLSLVIAVLAVLFLRLYVEMSWGQFWAFLGTALIATEIAIPISVVRGHRLLRPVREWIAGDRSPEKSVEAWRAAVTLPLDVWPRVWYAHPLLMVVTVTIGGALILDLTWFQALLLFGAAWFAVGYGVVLDSFTLAGGLRPVVADIATRLPPVFGFGRAALGLRYKLFIALPFINVLTGLVVAGLTSPENDIAQLGFDVLAATTVAFTVSLVLTQRLAESLLSPLAELVEAITKVERGDFDVAIPVTTGDEVGRVTLVFNRMVSGLAEREQIREAFGTYLDPDIARYVLEHGPSLSGDEVEVTVLFLDIRDFTGFAEASTPRAVVATLNELWDLAVPVVHAHGGHVDKFIGDGLLVVFGAPQPQERHADQALAAARQIVARVQQGFGARLHIGIGLNSGPVVAGNVGGGGRLSFSVIGDTVNVAARVEAATRQTDDPILLSEQTRRLLHDPPTLVEREGVELKGKREPVRVYAVR
jgi:adenylate cyclase